MIKNLAVIVFVGIEKKELRELLEIFYSLDPDFFCMSSSTVVIDPILPLDRHLSKEIAVAIDKKYDALIVSLKPQDLDVVFEINSITPYVIMFGKEEKYGHRKSHSFLCMRPISQNYKAAAKSILNFYQSKYEKKLIA